MNMFGTMLEKLGLKGLDITNVIKPGQFEPMTPEEAVPVVVNGALERTKKATVSLKLNSASGEQKQGDKPAWMLRKSDLKYRDPR